MPTASPPSIAEPDRSPASGGAPASDEAPIWAGAPTAHPAPPWPRPFLIGPIEPSNRLILAPMAGVTDRPFRTLCRRLGAGLTVSEMLSANPALRGSRKSAERSDHRGEPGPIAVQIAGADPALMADAARWNHGHGAEIIDINMGCPAKKVCQTAAGSALLRDEALVGRILAAVVSAVPIPVTLKTRTGWSPETRNLSRIAHIARESGIAALSVHGRTRACGYRGSAEFESLRAVRAETDLMLVANGDIDSPERARAVLDYTGADAMMIGRAAQGRPWLFREIEHYLATGRRLPPPPLDWVRDTLIEHLEAVYDFYGRSRGVYIARKHIGWYCRGSAASAGKRRTEDPATEAFLADINRVATTKQQVQRVRTYFDGLLPTEDVA